jgi:CHAD domain-containing protein
VLAWREVEVELVDGDEALLGAVGERLGEAGAAPSPSASKLARVLEQRLAAPAAPRSRKKNEKASAGAVVVAALAGQVQALQVADLAIRTDGPDGVHDLRVAARRLRSILAAFRAVLDRTATDPLRAELRWLGQQVSGARDGEVALGHLADLVARQPDELVLGPVAARIQQARIRDAEAGRTAAARALDDLRYLRLLDDLVALAASPPLLPAADASARRVLRAALRRSGRRLRRQVDTARDDPTGSALHEVRKAAKRLRYTAEVAEPVLGGRARRVRKVAKRVQTVLGRRQDTAVTRRFCRTLGLAALGAGENPWTFGRLEALEEARGDRATAEFWALGPRLSRTLRRDDS